MMRSLWTAASGMVAQQTNLDTISNNLSNINTTGYKTEAVNFKSLIYQTLQQKSYDSKGEPKPVSAQVGLGVRPAAIVSSFTQGALLESSGAFDYAIEGEGFFMVRQNDGTIGYTRMVISMWLYPRTDWHLPIPTEIRCWMSMGIRLHFRRERTLLNYPLTSLETLCIRTIREMPS